MGIMMITEKAYAKINLTLSVGEKREDGYHEIDSVMHSISLCDEVTLTEAGGFLFPLKKGLRQGEKQISCGMRRNYFSEKQDFPAVSTWNW